MKVVAREKRTVPTAANIIRLKRGSSSANMKVANRTKKSCTGRRSVITTTAHGQGDMKAKKDLQNDYCNNQDPCSARY